MHAALAATRYFLQEWGKHAWDAADASPIDLADVEQASGTATAALDESFFRVRFDRLTPPNGDTCGRWPSSVRDLIGRAMSHGSCKGR